jgi:hypothetical protein
MMMMLRQQGMNPNNMTGMQQNMPNQMMPNQTIGSG